MSTTLFVKASAKSPTNQLYFPGQYLGNQVLTAETAEGLGFVAVEFSERPASFVRTQATKIDGVWVGSWEEVTSSVREKDAFSDAAKQKRNQLLRVSDWTQIADAPVDQAAWAAYRQALRDITDQPGFPMDIQWPVAP